MREILFRGKDPETGTWYEGFYMALSDTTYCFRGDYDAHPDNTKHYIVFDRMTDWGLPNQHLRADADPSTVGQYTGLKDKHGKRIFEGDILRWTGEDGETGKVIVIFAGGSFLLKCVEVLDAPADPFDEFDRGCQTLEVIGNIHDNPELLKGGEG